MSLTEVRNSYFKGTLRGRSPCMLVLQGTPSKRGHRTGSSMIVAFEPKQQNKLNTRILNVCIVLQL